MLLITFGQTSFPSEIPFLAGQSLSLRYRFALQGKFYDNKQQVKAATEIISRTTCNFSFTSKEEKKGRNKKKIESEFNIVTLAELWIIQQI